MKKIRYLDNYKNILNNKKKLDLSNIKESFKIIKIELKDLFE
jgi:hypothetical protein